MSAFSHLVSAIIEGQIQMLANAGNRAPTVQDIPVDASLKVARAFREYQREVAEKLA